MTCGKLVFTIHHKMILDHPEPSQTNVSGLAHGQQCQKILASCNSVANAFIKSSSNSRTAKRKCGSGIPLQFGAGRSKIYRVWDVFGIRNKLKWFKCQRSYCHLERVSGIVFSVLISQSIKYEGICTERLLPPPSCWI